MINRLLLFGLLFLSISARVPDISAPGQSIGVFKSMLVSGASVTSTTIGNYNTAYGWGNHATAGYTTATSTTAFTNKSGNISQWTNNSGYLTGITGTQVNTALGYTAYSATNPNGYIASITSGNVTAALGYTPLNYSFAGTTSQYTKGNGTYGAFPTNVSSFTNDAGYITASYVPTMGAATRAINSTTFTVSATKQATVAYYISITCTATIGSTSSGQVELQYSTNAGSTWTAIGIAKNSNTVTLAIALNSITVQITPICATIPANALCRMVSTTAGTTTLAYNYGFETY